MCQEQVDIDNIHNTIGCRKASQEHGLGRRELLPLGEPRPACPDRRQARNPIDLGRPVGGVAGGGVGAGGDGEAEAEIEGPGRVARVSEASEGAGAEVAEDTVVAPGRRRRRRSAKSGSHGVGRRAARFGEVGEDIIWEWKGREMIGTEGTWRFSKGGRDGEALRTFQILFFFSFFLKIFFKKDSYQDFGPDVKFY